MSISEELSTHEQRSEGAASDDDGPNRLQPSCKYPSSTSSESSKLRRTYFVFPCYPTLKTVWCASVATRQRGFRRRDRINGVLSEVSSCLKIRRVISRVCSAVECVGKVETFAEVVASRFSISSDERAHLAMVGRIPCCPNHTAFGLHASPYPLPYPARPVLGIRCGRRLSNACVSLRRTTAGRGRTHRVFGKETVPSLVSSTPKQLNGSSAVEGGTRTVR